MSSIITLVLTLIMLNLVGCQINDDAAVSKSKTQDSGAELIPPQTMDLCRFASEDIKAKLDAGRFGPVTTGYFNRIDIPSRQDLVSCLLLVKFSTDIKLAQYVKNVIDKNESLDSFEVEFRGNQYAVRMSLLSTQQQNIRGCGPSAHICQGNDCLSWWASSVHDIMPSWLTENQLGNPSESDVIEELQMTLIDRDTYFSEGIKGEKIGLPMTHIGFSTAEDYYTNFLIPRVTAERSISWVEGTSTSGINYCVPVAPVVVDFQ